MDFELVLLDTPKTISLLFPLSAEEDLRKRSERAWRKINSGNTSNT